MPSKEAWKLAGKILELLTVPTNHTKLHNEISGLIESFFGPRPMTEYPPIDENYSDKEYSVDVLICNPSIGFCIGHYEYKIKKWFTESNWNPHYWFPLPQIKE